MFVNEQPKLIDQPLSRGNVAEETRSGFGYGEEGRTTSVIYVNVRLLTGVPVVNQWMTSINADRACELLQVMFAPSETRVFT